MRVTVGGIRFAPFVGHYDLPKKIRRQIMFSNRAVAGVEGFLIQRLEEKPGNSRMAIWYWKTTRAEARQSRGNPCTR